LQGFLAILVALLGTYESILNYVVSIDVIFFSLTACCIFVFRRYETATGEGLTRVPGHPFTTMIFIAGCWLVAINTVYKYPTNTLIGMAIMAAGIPAYLFWRWRSSK
jgi:APA family basic amino acid/polyamine antiporter